MTNWKIIIKKYKDRSIYWIIHCLLAFWCSSTPELEEYLNTLSDEKVKEILSMKI